MLTMASMPDVHRVRVQWDCDGTSLLIHMRDDGPGDLSDATSQMQLLRQRIHALSGRITVEATPGWGTEMAIAIPLDPPRAVNPAETAWDLRPVSSRWSSCSSWVAGIRRLPRN
jgi:signal transduction histidine kinase